MKITKTLDEALQELSTEHRQFVIDRLGREGLLDDALAELTEEERKEYEEVIELWITYGGD